MKGGTDVGKKHTKHKKNHHPSKSKDKKHVKRHHKKRRSSKKKGIFGCCAKKKGKKVSKSTTKTKKSKQPKQPAVVEQPPALANEQMGNVLLVKDVGEAVPKAEEEAKNAQVAKIVNQSANEKKAPSEKKNEVPENKEAAEKPPVTKEEENKKDEKKSDSAEKKKKNIGSKESGENKKTNIGEAVCNDEERKERWLIYASSVLDTNMITTEFASVAGYIPSSISRTEWLKNMRDNRFMDIVCMDHSRVILHTGGYIHASWITISDDKKAIATQLPLPHTASRFWRMILENGVKGVLLLITEEEYKQMGGEFTFPASQDFLYFKEGSLRVGEFQRVTIKNNWTMRVISVTNGNKKSFIHLHHLSSWPHGKTPSDLIDLWQVQSVMRKYSGPHVYVSLSGCGRAGTFATFEVAHASLHKERLTSFSVEESLKQVRAGRLHAVQNAAQYSSVHSLLAEHILNNGVSKLVTCRGSENPEENVRKLIDSLVLPLADDQDGVAG